MTRLLLLLLLLSPFAAHAQLQYSTVAGSGYKDLDLAVLDPATKYNVRWAGCKPPMSFLLRVNGGGDLSAFTNPWPEKTAPCDFQGDPNLIAFVSGSYTLEVVGTTVTATFIVTQPGPVPPIPQPVTGTKITWTQDLTNVDGSVLADLVGFRFYRDGAQVDEVANPSLRSWTPPSSGTYYLTNYTKSGAESHPSPSVGFTLAVPPPPPPPPPPVEVWKVASNGVTPDRPVVEPVQNLAGTALVSGGAQGRIVVGKICGAQAFKSGTASYRYVDESDLTLASPTYKGRAHVTMCTKAP